MTTLDKWAMAIMEFEGWSKGSISYKNNNPGNIKWPNTPHDKYGHSIFTTFHEGWDTLVKQLTMAVTGKSKVYQPDMTLLEFFSKYAEANSKPYAEFVARRLGISIWTQIKLLK